MADDFGKQVGRFFKGIRDKTAETMARQQASFVRGRVAGTAVHADDGSLIVDSGHLIDDPVIARAERAGKLGALVVSAGAAQMQDLKEKASETLSNTQDGREAHSLNSVDEFREALGYSGRYTGVDVTDIRGNVVVPAGKKIDAADVRAARDAGLLSALIYSSQQGHATAEAAKSEASSSPDASAPTPAPPKKRASLPIIGPNSDKK